MAGNGGPDLQRGCAIYLYAANRPMERFFYDADADAETFDFPALVSRRQAVLFRNGQVMAPAGIVGSARH